jgi:hypothetical protein
MKVIESNCETGEVTERDMTQEEVAAVLASQPPAESEQQQNDAETTP